MAYARHDPTANRVPNPLPGLRSSRMSIDSRRLAGDDRSRLVVEQGDLGSPGELGYDQGMDPGLLLTLSPMEPSLACHSFALSRPFDLASHRSRHDPERLGLAATSTAIQILSKCPCRVGLLCQAAHHPRERTAHAALCVPSAPGRVHTEVPPPPYPHLLPA